MVDILMATYNGEAYIEEQLVSIFEQSCQNYHLYIRDDGSTDNTINIINNITSQYGMESQVTLISDGDPSGSAKNNFIRLMSYSENDYTMFADQDDIWNKNKIEVSLKRIKMLEAKYSTSVPFLVHTDLEVVDEKGEHIADSLIDYMNLSRKDNIKTLLLQNSVTGCTMIVNKAAMKLLKKADESGGYSIHDHFAAVLIATFGHVSLLDEPTVKYRQHSGNVIGASNAKSLLYMTGRFAKGRNNFRNEMNVLYEQALYIVTNYADELLEISQEKRNFIKEFAELKTKSSTEKRDFFRSHGMYKKGALKTIFQLIWC